VSDIKVFRHAVMVGIMICYFIALIAHSDFWGNILSPMAAAFTLIITFRAYVVQGKKAVNRMIGLNFSLGILTYATADILWALCDLVWKVDPNEVFIITLLYSLTNLFLALGLTIYGFVILRKWNIIQMILDSLIITYLLLMLIWFFFFDTRIEKFMEVQGDPLSFGSIALDVLIITWLVIWYVAVRAGNIPNHIRVASIGALLYAVVDLVYYYQYFYDIYSANSILDGFYMISLVLFAVSGMMKIKLIDADDGQGVFNVGQRNRSLYLLLAPSLLIIFKGIDVNQLLILVSVILFHSIISSYVQTNIFKEEELRNEKKLNNELEKMVQLRTKELEDSNRALQQLIDQDYTTGLYNRRYLLSYLDNMIKILDQEKRIVLLYIDMNRYKMINTMFGNDISDRILAELANRLKPLSKWTDRSITAVYREDSFVFAGIGLNNYEDAHRLAIEAVRLCSDIYHIEGYQIRITVNIGISIYPLDAANKEELIRHADLAMTQARKHGYNMIHEYDFNLSDVYIRKNSIELLMRKASYDQEFMVYYQPQLDTETRRLTGFEALLRWKTSTGEFISPGEFIPVAEESGYIIPIGAWAMKNVLRQMVNWNNRLKRQIMIGINVSLKQLNTEQFIGKLKTEMESIQVKPEWVDLEITESLQLQENPEAIKKLEELRACGIHISIDDFGTGYSSLSYFKSLQADRIKLAKELIDMIHTDDFDYQLVKSMIQLSHARGIKVIAEGVETEEQWATLRELQCDEVQGFYFGRPVPVSEVERIYQKLLTREED